MTSAMTPISSACMGIMKDAVTVVLAEVCPAVVPVEVRRGLIGPFIPYFDAVVAVEAAGPAGEFSERPWSFTRLPPPGRLVPAPVDREPVRDAAMPIAASKGGFLGNFEGLPEAISGEPPVGRTTVVRP